MRWMIWLVMVMSGSAVADDAPLSPAVDGRLADASAVSDPTVRRLIEAAAPLGMPVVEGGGGADIRPLGEQGVLRIGFRPDDTTYFDVHHTAADTLDKVDPTALAESTAALAALAWQMANH